ncbi:MAG TPA: hypothetical protein VFB49_10105 [Patescibacteria group bacterium]|nr:hypothetical protein [Patescibacteria group bacterium]
MKKSWSDVSTVIVSASLIALTAGPLLAATGDNVTAGDLALQLARAAGINLPVNDSRQAALQSLRKAGIDLGTDPKTTVTQKVLVEVGQSLWVKVTSVHPDAPASPAMCSAFIRSFKGTAQSAAASSGQGKAGTENASCQGRTSRAGREGTPASPSDPNSTDGPCEPGS